MRGLRSIAGLGEGLRVTRGGTQYYQKTRSLLGSALIGYWPVWETSGATAFDQAGSGRNATYRAGGLTLGNVAGPNGKPAPTFPGTGGDIFFAPAIAGAWNGQEIGFAAWIKVLNAGVWADGQYRKILQFMVDGSNYFNVYKADSVNSLTVLYVANGVASSVGEYRSNTTWIHVTADISKSGDFLKLGINGVQAGPTSTGLGAWAGAVLDTDYSAFGSLGNGAQFWAGSMCDLILTNRAKTDAENRALCTLSPTRTYYLSILGDSLSQPGTGTQWHDVLISAWKSGQTGKINHAVGGHAIVTNGKGQADATLTDDANVIADMLGANDDNAGDVDTMIAKQREVIQICRANNPRATYIKFNVPQLWEDNTGAVEKQKGNVRFAVATACAAEGVTCVDVYSNAGLQASDTLDGVHWTVAGHAKMAAFIQAQLPA